LLIIRGPFDSILGLIGSKIKVKVMEMSKSSFYDSTVNFCPIGNSCQHVHNSMPNLVICEGMRSTEALLVYIVSDQAVDSLELSGLYSTLLYLTMTLRTMNVKRVACCEESPKDIHQWSSLLFL